MTTWHPTDDIIKATNLYALMQQQGLNTYAAIHRWSVENRAAFTEHTLKRLGIVFQQPYRAVLDTSNGIPGARWFADARMNITDSCFKGQPTRPAIITRRHNGTMQTVTEGELQTMANRIANALVARGLRKGDAVAIDMPMTVEAVAAYLGIIKAGMVVVSVPDALPPEQIAIRFTIGNAKAVFTQTEIVREDKRLPLYAKVCAPEVNAPPAIVVRPFAETTAVTLRDGDVLWDDFLSTDTAFTSVVCDPNDATNIIFSSGTTGTPKAIPWDHTTPLKAAFDSHYHQDIHAGDVLCWPTNLGWMMGPWLLYAAFINGAAVALHEGAPTERGFCQLVQDAKVTMLGLVPSIAVGWRSTGNGTGLDWGSIRCFSSSGEASNPEVYGWLMTFNQPAGAVKPVIEYCGGTEVGGAYITDTLLLPLGPSEFNAKSMGSDFVVVDADMQPCAPGDTGEVFLLAPALGLSTRLHNGDNTAVYYDNCPTDGTTAWRRHGDLMTIIKDGYWQSNGRAGNDMNLGGIKVGSPEIERVVNTVAGVVESAAIGVPTPGGGPDRLVIYVVAADGAPAIDELQGTIQKAIKTGLNPLFHVHDVVPIATLPRTASNKVMHRELRAQYAAQNSNAA
jgi:acetyl-CoA synthetase